LVKVVGSQTGSSGERPTNQRYIRRRGLRLRPRLAEPRVYYQSKVV
jgi:hypothetical protein